MRTFSASAAIKAPAQVIWALLTDAPAYPSWNVTIERIEGTIAPGKKVKVYPKGGSGTRAFPLKVVTFDPGKKMVWRGGMPLGLFTGERTFTLAPRPDGQIDFTMSEEFSGPLAGLIEKSLPDLQPAFDAFAQSLKRRAEAGA